MLRKQYKKAVSVPIPTATIDDPEAFFKESIFKSSLENGQVPDILKCAYMSPLYSGQESNPYQYAIVQ